MSELRLKSIKIKNYRSFGEEQSFEFPNENYKKPIAIVGYNNSGKTNLMNAIQYGIGLKYVSENTFTKADLHNLDYNNLIEITAEKIASYYSSKGTLNGVHTINVALCDNELKSTAKPTFFGAAKHYNIFNINFHCVKDEISTKKTTWGTLTSFLARHIQKIVENDSGMKNKKETFEKETREATNKILDNSHLSKFIETIERNYRTNLRGNRCEVIFGFPDYEDIFLQMMFKVGLNCDNNNTELVSISHFGDGYISMFVMAVIQAIAESDVSDKCLFLFEEPESFLHENHQDYFYKTVLCNLAEKGHQVIYTTHSDRMIDIFDTESIIRIEFDEKEKQTVKKYNEIHGFSSFMERPTHQGKQIISLDNYNSFIKSIEPNLNKILFSRKVLLVEGPNDIMAYKYAIQKKIKQVRDEKFAETFLSFSNIAIVAHHGKATALLLIELCKHIHVDYFAINDFDLDKDIVEELSTFQSIETLKESNLYLMDGENDRSSVDRGIISTNWNLINQAGKDNIHFNIKKLETVIGYEKDDKKSVQIWKKLNELLEFSLNFFPPQLETFLELNKISLGNQNEIEELQLQEFENDLPF